MTHTVAVVGASGNVGREMLKILEQHDFPVKKLIPLASSRSAGQKLKFKGQDLIIEDLSAFDFTGVDIVLASPGALVSAEYAPKAVAKGAVWIDNTSYFRMHKDVPLVVPEVNPEAIKDWNKMGVIANPNCSTIQMVVALKPLYDYSRITRVIVSTYQAASGAGLKAMQECEAQTRAVLNGEPAAATLFAHQIAFNLIPHIDVFTDNGYTKEEMKMVYETRKILEDDEIRIAATCVRVPIMRAHSEAITVETEKNITPAKARELFENAPGLIVKDDPSRNEYPMPFFVTGRDEVYVGRIRKDISSENGLAFWCVGDQILKGAALNAVQIAERVIAL